MDPLSDVLRAVKLDGAYFYLVEAGAPWSVLTVPARELVPRVLPQAEHLISYHVLLRGHCWGGLDGDSQVEMEAGDVIVFPHGDSHLMSSDRGLQLDVQSEAAARYPGTMVLGPPSARETMFVCGFLGCEARPYNPLLASLPRQLHAPGIAGGWLSQFPTQAVAESRRGRVGGETMLTRMAELMFIEVVRRHVERQEARQGGWLGALTDGVVGPALAQMHERPGHPWTLGELARACASSRSVLVQRFTRLVGVSPMLYLKRWRLQLAAEQLVHGGAKVATIGTRVGYDSEAAFSRAFKRETGLSPTAWRASHAR